ncbi:MAG: hypothetical protein IAF58_04760, partial [Leptolyngbya sp.]|nr:hypothetical protein [Candidatus Melainabacteria bacterium]
MSIENNHENFSVAKSVGDSAWNDASLSTYCFSESLARHGQKGLSEVQPEVAFLDFKSIFEVQKPQTEGKFVSEKVSEDVQKKLVEVNVSVETAEKVLKEINAVGKEPIATLASLMEKNRVLGIGESHESPNPQRDLGVAAMDSLKKAGATHLAIEAPMRIQPQLDAYMKTGKLSIDDLPPLLRSKDYMDILERARINKIKIVAVDENYTYDDGSSSPSIKLAPAHRAAPTASRDELMTEGVSQILKEDPKNKVIFWVGSLHLADDLPPNSPHDSKVAAGLLREKYTLATVP